MGDVIPWPKEPVDVWACGTCGAKRFVLLMDGTVECGECQTPSNLKTTEGDDDATPP